MATAAQVKAAMDAGYSIDEIEQHLGNALEILPKLTQKKYDLVFLDWSPGLNTTESLLLVMNSNLILGLFSSSK